MSTTAASGSGEPPAGRDYGADKNLPRSGLLELRRAADAPISVVHDRDICDRLAALSQDGFAPELMWKHVDTQADALREEGALLRAYFAEHRELPPLNHKKDWVP